MTQIDTLQTAYEHQATHIRSWKEKADWNIAAETTCHRTATMARLFSSSVSLALLQVASRGVQIPVILGILMAVLVVLVAAAGEYATEMSRRHEYGVRWPRIRAALDGMIADLDAAQARAGEWHGLNDQESAALLTVRRAAWVARARGQAAQSPIPQAARPSAS